VNIAAKVLFEGQSEAIDAVCQDLSIGGGYLLLVATVSFGTKLLVTLHVGNDEIAMQAIVRWVGADGFGVQFGLMGAKETHVLAQIMRANR
jgi:type IV pilus assembly protein PilZ